MEDKSLEKEEAQTDSKKLPYPKGIFFITTNEFCERFCYYGMRTVLSIYLTDYLLYSEKDATIIYHTFIMLAYFFPLFGAMIADGFLGKFKTMFYISMIYVLGNITLSLAAVTPLGLPHRELSLIGLLFIAIGTGGIKPCVAPLGGDQFVLPQQEPLIAQFFALFYFAINLGSLISTALTPVLREDVHCFGEDSCFPLAFGVPAVLMICAITVLGLGKPFYRLIPPEGNLIGKVAMCMWNAAIVKLRNKGEKLNHWLDYSVDKYGPKLVQDIKGILGVLLMFVPMPIFWALVDQLGTAWTFQARRMDGYIGFYTILPDQMQFANSLLYLSWIPVFEYVIYPIFNKYRILTTSLQRITCGGVVTALSFVLSGCVSLALENTYPVLPSAGNGQIRIYNTLPCDVAISSSQLFATDVYIPKGDYYRNIDLELSGNMSYSYTATSSCANFSGTFEVYEQYSVGYFFNNSNKIAEYFLDDISKDTKGLPKIRTLVNNNGVHSYTNVTYLNSKGDTKIATNSGDSSIYSISPDTYTIQIGNSVYTESFYLGGVYAVLATAINSSNYEFYTIEVTPANSIHMLWLLPQYIVLTFGELMFSIPGVEFSYSQAPVSMKSVVLSCWLLTTAFGNLIVIIIQSLSIFERASYNFFLYAALMFVDMIIFALLAMRYKYVAIENPDNLDVTKKKTNNNAI